MTRGASWQGPFWRSRFCPLVARLQLGDHQCMGGEMVICAGGAGAEENKPAASAFRLTVDYRAGVWEVSMSTAAHGKDTAPRGFGATFNETWENMNPTRDGDAA